MTEVRFTRVVLTGDKIKTLINKQYGLMATSITKLNSYDDANYHIMVDSGQVHNKYMTDIHESGYTLKILNSQTSKYSKIVEFQNEAIHCVRNSGINTATLVFNVNGEEWSIEVLPSEDGKTDRFLVRLFTFIPGKPLKSVPLSTTLADQIGSVTGKIDIALKSMKRPSDLDYSHWNMEVIPDLLNSLHYIQDVNNRQLLHEIITSFQLKVLNTYDRWQQGLIHGDVNEGNILVTEVTSVQSQTNHEVTAIIDFGDMSYSLYIFEISIAMIYMAMLSPDQDIIHLPGRVLKGYLNYIKLTTEELSVIKLCMCARAAQSVIRGVMCQSSQSQEIVGLKVIHKLWKIPDEDILQKWMETV